MEKLCSAEDTDKPSSPLKKKKAELSLRSVLKYIRLYGKCRNKTVLVTEKYLECERV